MTKKADTDERNLDEMLEALAKPKPLEHKEKGESSQGRDAVEYHAAPRAPAARVDHNTFPDAPIIVNQTNPLQVTLEERKRLEADLDARRKRRERDERNADTAPRKTDPPGVSSDPPGVPKRSLLRPFAALALVALVVAGIAVAMHTKSGESTAASSATTPPVQTSALATQASTPVAPTHVAPPETTTTTARPTATHTNVAPPPTVRTASPTITAPTTTAPTATTVAPPDLRGTN